MGINSLLNLILVSPLGFVVSLTFTSCKEDDHNDGEQRGGGKDDILRTTYRVEEGWKIMVNDLSLFKSI